MVDWNHRIKAVAISAKIGKAIKKGEMVRPNTCELCGDKPSPINVNLSNGVSFQRSKIVAHHWCGYDHPLDVWHICQRCNSILRGPHFHNGSVTKEEARQIVLSIYNTPPKLEPKKCKDSFITLYGVEMRCGCWSQKGTDYCYHHQPKTKP
jgi:hypothetical protein